MQRLCDAELGEASQGDAAHFECMKRTCAAELENLWRMQKVRANEPVRDQRFARRGPKDQETGEPPSGAGFEADQVLIFEADQEGDKSATEIAKTCTDQETGKPLDGVGFGANQVQLYKAGQEGDKSATEIAKTCTDQETGEPPGGTGL